MFLEAWDGSCSEKDCLGLSPGATWQENIHRLIATGQQPKGKVWHIKGLRN